MTLNQLKIGEVGIIQDIHANPSLTQRFLDMGFCREAKVQCILESPGKDPKAYLIKGTQIAIRNEDAKEIKIQPAFYSENVENKEEKEWTK